MDTSILADIEEDGSDSGEENNQDSSSTDEGEAEANIGILGTPKKFIGLTSSNYMTPPSSTSKMFEEGVQRVVKQMRDRKPNLLGLSPDSGKNLLSIEAEEQILEAADISETDLAFDEERKLRLSQWMENIMAMEQERRTRLSTEQLRLEDEVATEWERIGWALRRMEMQWERNEDPRGYNKRLKLHTSSGRRRIRKGVTSKESQGRYGSAQPRKTIGRLEETNVALIEIDHNTTDRRSTLCPASEMITIESTTIEHEVESEDDDDYYDYDFYENEDWRTFLLQEGMRHIHQLDLHDLPGTWPTKDLNHYCLRVYRDHLINIPDNLRQTWYNLIQEMKFVQEQLRGDINQMKSKIGGALENYAPSLSNEPELTAREYSWELAEEYDGWKVDQRTDYDIEEEYDRWYWRFILHVLYLLQQKVSFSQALKEIKHKMQANHEGDFEDEWRAYHYFMYKAVLRNRTYKCLPPWLAYVITNC